MAYEKQTWATGDIVTADKLNHIEDGIAASIMVVTIDLSMTFNKTWNEVKNALAGGIPVFVLSNGSDGDDIEIYMYRVVGVEGYDDQFEVMVSNPFEQTGYVLYSTNSADGYPMPAPH